jgi:hypothetical protein
MFDEVDTKDCYEFYNNLIWSYQGCNSFERLEEEFDGQHSKLIKTLSLKRPPTSGYFEFKQKPYCSFNKLCETIQPLENRNDELIFFKEKEESHCKTEVFHFENKTDLTKDENETTRKPDARRDEESFGSEKQQSQDKGNGYKKRE